jgi:vacuolar protein sorting-associated protein IST1
MAVQRIQLQINKRTNAVKKDKREISRMLAEEKEEKARIRTEHVIRQDFHIGALEITQLFCELLHERMPLIVSEKNCPPDLEETVCTLIWVANRLEIAELAVIQKQLTKKYGTEFRDRALVNENGCVNDRIVSKLLVTPPTAFLVQQYLLEIAKEFNVDWVPSVPISPDDPNIVAAPAPTGFSVPMAPASQYGNVYQANVLPSSPPLPPQNPKQFMQPQVPPSNFSSFQPPFNSNPPPFNSNPPPFNSNPPPFNSNPPPFNSNPPPFNSNPPPFNPTQSPFNSAPPPFNSTPPPFNPTEPTYNPNQPMYQGQLKFPPPGSTTPSIPPTVQSYPMSPGFPGNNNGNDSDETKKQDFPTNRSMNQNFAQTPSIPMVEAFQVEIEEPEQKNGEDDIPSLDELTKRFQDLRK